MHKYAHTHAHMCMHTLTNAFWGAQLELVFIDRAHADRRLVHAWFLEITFVQNVQAVKY